MIDDFFRNLFLPSFLLEYFQKQEWYLLVKDLKSILASNLKDTQVNSTNPTLITKGQLYIGPNCTIGDYVVIEGPVYIDAEVEIGPHAYIRPGSVISKKCSIGPSAIIKNSIMMEEAKIANHVFLGDSIIGVKARLGGHCETANRRFDQEAIDFSYKNFKIQTGLDKLGMVLGEGSRLGGGVFTAPGTMIGYNSFVSTMAFVSGYIPANKFIKLEMETDMVDNRFAKELKHTNLYDRV